MKSLILTSAGGAVNKKYRPADIVILKDHINFMGSNPLRGCHHASWRARFPDMSEAYDGAMREFEESLKRLRTDHVDLLQIHGARIGEDLAAWGKSDGVN